MVGFKPDVDIKRMTTQDTLDLVAAWGPLRRWAHYNKVPALAGGRKVDIAEGVEKASEDIKVAIAQGISVLLHNTDSVESELLSRQAPPRSTVTANFAAKVKRADERDDLERRVGQLLAPCGNNTDRQAAEIDKFYNSLSLHKMITEDVATVIRDAWKLRSNATGVIRAES